jgi:hypothetical protein
MTVWAGPAVAALMFMPVVVWNAARDWAGFEFQLHQGLGGGGGWSSGLLFVGSQLLLGGPVLFPLALGWMVRGPRAEWMLRAATGVPLTFFGLAASRTRGETNWPGPAYLSACVGLAGGPPRWTRIAIIAGIAVILVGSSHLLVPLARPARDASLSNLQGWGSLRELRHLGPRVVFASTYRLASEVAYYSGLETHVPGRRRQQFAYWPEPVLAPGEDALWISERGEPPFGLRRRFEGIEGPRILRTAYASRTVHEFKVWTLVKLRESDESDRTSHVLELRGDRPKGEST